MVFSLESPVLRPCRLIKLCKYFISGNPFDICFIFRARKFQLHDFDKFYKPSKYFPSGDVPKYGEFGQDHHHLAGLHSSNLALAVR